MFLDYESCRWDRTSGRSLLTRVRRSAVLLVVVGDQWLDGEIGQRPIDRSDDWVRLEILEALDHGVPVVPVLFGNGKVLRERLPDKLARLSDFQRFQINRNQRADIKSSRRLSDTPDSSTPGSGSPCTHHTLPRRRNR